MTPQQDFLQELTQRLDQLLNGPETTPSSTNKTTGFILLVFPLGVETGVCSIACNGLTRESVAEMLRLQGELLTKQPN